MANALTVKGQVTIPKRVRDALGLKPGDEVDFIVDDRGQVVLQPARPSSAPPSPDPDRFDRAVGTATFKWASTDEYMKFIRGDDHEPD